MYGDIRSVNVTLYPLTPLQLKDIYTLDLHSTKLENSCSNTDLQPVYDLGLPNWRVESIRYPPPSLLVDNVETSNRLMV